MRSIKALELINKGKIEELKVALQEEVYLESLDKKSNAKKRYNAMKKYFTYYKGSRECLQKPCVIEYENREYICFTNSWSMVFTTESCGEIELFDKENGTYPNVTRLINFEGIKRKINFSAIIAEAKTKGYKLNKTEVGYGFRYLMCYDDTYYKLGLLDATYSIIDDGKEAMVYHPDGPKQPLTIENSLGICMIMPVFMHDGKPNEEHIVVNVVL